MMNPLSATERSVLFYILAMIGIASILPPIFQPESYHFFADQRSWQAIPNFADVVSNLIFAATGMIGLYRLKSVANAELQKLKLPLSVFFAGLLFTAPGSAFYHWTPGTQTILVDRLPMAIAFAGIIGTFLAQRVSVRAGMAGLSASLIIGGAGLVASATSGNLALYLVLQFGGLAGLIAGLHCFRSCDDRLPWWQLIGWYVLAKAFELNDHLVWELTQQMVSGHTLKHLAAGMSGIVLLRAISDVVRQPACRCPGRRRHLNQPVVLPSTSSRLAFSRPSSRSSRVKSSSE